MRQFYSSILVALLGLSAAFYWAGPTGLWVAFILGVMEVSLSFDNAVVNATVLKQMSPVWQRRFLTWGMVFAVFGVRFLLPVLIVALVTGQSFQAVSLLILENPQEYARQVQASHVQISAFGGMYLLLVFLSFLMEENKSLHWLVWIEKRLSRMGKLESIEVAVSLCALLFAQHFLPPGQRAAAMVAGTVGVILFVLVKSLSNLFDASEPEQGNIHKLGFLSFLYLEMLDLSFSLDGVIGAFAITRDVVVILLGLTIGAMFVRSLTLFLVRRRLLEEYLYLEHGAHYAIGALAVLMLADMKLHVPEWIPASTGMAFIALSLWSSLRARRREATT